MGLCFGRESPGAAIAPEAQALINAATAGFRETFDSSAEAVGVSPGRVEVIGNHTDYNDGFILSAAINRFIVAAGRRTETGVCRVKSAQFPNAPLVMFPFSLGDPLPKQEGEFAWANYVGGVLEEFRQRGIDVGGLDIYITSNIPSGAGVSSSAACELAVAKLVKFICKGKTVHLTPLDLVLLCKSAENNFVGMPCGILDQFTASMGKQGHLVFLDCRDNGYEHVPLDRNVSFVLANTKAPHQLVDGKYAELNRSCMNAAKYFKDNVDEKVTHLRDVTVEMWEVSKETLSTSDRDRSKHIVFENKRVFACVEALRGNDAEMLGKLMRESHQSSSEGFGNSCLELDAMVKAAEGLPGWYGGRLMGGGFGGCTINLVHTDRAVHFGEELSKRYEAETGIHPDVFIVTAADGAFATMV
uniref:Galactokinase n=1 Tax=Noctiluca scintillans TaxID=2966 RepID=A0A7S1EVP5_NOCSC|mmetsp:Transcript_11095/g.30645  ORF Transcript_11095/g.30645 Transcript_11095/m.30645 type:complete len:415 (+) Transcript_11095:72-1316(+)|eukprot:CAMPEP_0194534286 /NCGR_PEP_ID=MMETSP0253-20130528/72428_1 /TAXON_ID=2966 /ORGANISM="Noctiluca scintillans" /LENGTH=414 /DNA_ID=CAMNT_0039379933 /DNA_START=12 /DNA_END=1256 /DNA_ORIENTATION=+